MRLSDQQHLGIRSSPRQCMRSKFLHSSHAPHGSSPSPAAGMIQLWLCSLGHPTPPGTLCHLQLRKFNVLLSPSDYRKTEAAILCGTIAQEGFFLYNCGQNRMEIHLDNQVYFKCWHWALLSRIHVQAQNFQQQQEQSNGDSQEVNLKAAEQFGEVTVTALQSKGSQTQVYCLESFRSRGVLFVYIPSNFLLTVIWKNPVGRIWGRLQKHQEVLSPLDCCKSLKGQKIFLRKILSGGKAEDGEKLQR